MAFDVARIRGLYPGLGADGVRLDGSAGMLVPEEVASAVCTAMRTPVSAPDGVFPASHRADDLLAEARAAVADLVGANPETVVLGPNTAVLLTRLADALAGTWTLGDDVVLSRLDEQATLAPWLRAARRVGADVRWGEIDIETCELPAWQYEELIGPRTKAVAVTVASGAVGTRPDVDTVVGIARRAGALSVVDATHAAPFVPLDLERLGADVLVVSARAWGGPELSALVFRDAETLDRVPPVALDAPASGPQRLELGPHPIPQLAGLVTSVEHLARLDDAAAGSRRERLLTSLGSAKSYHAGLLAQLSTELRAMRRIMVLGDATRRIPALAFTVSDRKATAVARHLAEHDVCVFAEQGADGVFASLGVGEVGGALRVGLAHYTTPTEITALIHALETLP